MTDFDPYNNSLKQVNDQYKRNLMHNQPEPMPKTGDQDVTSAVIRDLEQRAQVGEKKYGSRLQTNNGRDALVDLYQELLDACQYIKQILMEREGVRDCTMPGLQPTECEKHIACFKCPYYK